MRAVAVESLEKACSRVAGDMMVDYSIGDLEVAIRWTFASLEFRVVVP
jgi:GTP:adenosylcobinamide-phosphate guanylyltransferase